MKITADMDHVLEDTVKNIQSATDAIKSIMCAFPKASTKTMKKITIFFRSSNSNKTYPAEIFHQKQEHLQSCRVFLSTFTYDIWRKKVYDRGVRYLCLHLRKWLRFLSYDNANSIRFECVEPIKQTVWGSTAARIRAIRAHGCRRCRYGNEVCFFFF